jgi:Ser/Thr protein kinase RdoA (MazF antagonist)
MISIREIQAIVREYPAAFQPTRIEPLGSAGGLSGAQFCRLESPRGTFVLRRWPTEHPSPERLLFIHEVLFHAAAGGVTFLALPIRTASGATFVRRGGDLWELARWMPGAADYERSPTIEKLRAAMRALATFHKAVSDFPLAAEHRVARAPAIAGRLRRIKELSSRDVDALSQAITKDVWPELSPLAHRFIGLLPQCAKRASAQLEPLAAISFPLQPCLRDIWHDHVLFTGDDVTGIIDFGAVDIDTPVTDIARLLGSLVRDDANGWRTGLAAYSEVQRLTDVEVRAARALDTSGTVVAGCNWLRWVYIDGRRFENRRQVIERFRRIVARCELAVDR